MRSLDNIGVAYILDWKKMRILIGIFPDYLIKEAALKTMDCLLAILSKVKCRFTKNISHRSDMVRGWLISRPSCTN